MIIYATGEFPTKNKLKPILGIASLVWDLPVPAAGTVSYDVDIPIKNIDVTVGVEEEIEAGKVTVLTVTNFPDGIRVNIEVDNTASVTAQDLIIKVVGNDIVLSNFINIIGVGGTFQPSTAVTLEVNSAVGGGGGWTRVTEVTATRTASANEFILVNATTCTITLPAPLDSATIAIKSIVVPTDIQIRTSGAGINIDGTDYSTTGLAFTTHWEQISLISDGVHWYIY